MSWLGQLKNWARTLRREVLLLWLAARDRRVAVLPKVLAALVVGYALSPIDLIPDFIPVLGLLDDLILLPAGIWLTLRLIPEDLQTELREQATDMAWPKPSLPGAVVIGLVWITLLVTVICWWQRG